MELQDLLTDREFLARKNNSDRAARQFEALQRLARVFAEDQEVIMQRLVDIAVEFCGADSSGISLEEKDENGEVRFRWIAVAGSFAPHLNRTTPRNYSPCGTCLDSRRPQHYRVWQPYYDFLGVVAEPIADGILIPLTTGETSGTIWAVSHASAETFDIHDYNLLNTIADFASVAIRNRERDRKITNAKTAEEAQRRLAAIVESSDDAIVSKDLNGIVQSWNRKAEEMFGYKEEEIVGRPITTIIPPELHGDEEMILRKIRIGEKIEHFETVRVTKTGERIDVSLSISPVRNEEGQVVGAAKIARNITERKRIQNALQITEKLAAAGRLAATVAHEINNPLESLTNLVYLARSTKTWEEVQKYLSMAEEELNRVSELTRQTLGFYRDTKSVESVNLAALVPPVVSVFQRKAMGKHIEIRSELDRDAIISAVPGELRQLLANLLSNSIDASPNGGQICIRVARRKEWSGHHRTGVRITVADGGSGIPREIMAKLFDPFFTTKRDVGTGLGLWVCKNIVEKHGGAIRVRSSTKPGHSGAVFSVFLPSDSARRADLTA